MIGAVLAWLFPCSHSRTTFPIKAKGSGSPHIACLDCGREFWYDWDEMRVVKAPGQKPATDADATDAAAT